MFHFPLFKNESVVMAHAWVSTVSMPDGTSRLGGTYDGPTHLNDSNIASVILSGDAENYL